MPRHIQQETRSKYPWDWKCLMSGSSSSEPAYYKFTVNEDGNSCTLTSAQFQTSGVLPQQYRQNINITIPATAGGLTVTAIGNRVFGSCSNVKSITIPESVKEIGDYSFQGCSSLVTLNLGGVEKIGNSCFYFSGADYQKKLTAVDLSKVKVIGNNSFVNFPNLVDVTLSPELESLGTGSFQGCPKVELEFPENSRYTVIDKIVYECNGTGADKKPQTLLMLQPNFNDADVTVPATVTSIASRAFEGNSSIQSIDLGNVQTVGNYAFMNCPKLRDSGRFREYRQARSVSFQRLHIAERFHHRGPVHRRCIRHKISAQRMYRSQVFRC